ncbi:MAG: IS3 family transposase [Fimbriimonadaceae bacterium]|nr:IS3 family transposase [Fimbriimonadaceae bacterium]
MTQRLELARSLASTHPVRLLCRLLEVPRSTVLYEPAPRAFPEFLEETILSFRAVFPCAGVRYMHELLRRYQVQASRSQIRKIYETHGLLGKPPRRRIHTTDSQHLHPVYPNRVKGLAIVRADQVWVSDVTFIRVASRWAYLDLILDAFTRRILSWALGFGNTTALYCEALERALFEGTPEIHHSDQGRPYASPRYTRILSRLQVQISMARTGSPWENGLAERVNRTIKEEEVLRSEYRSLAEARLCLSNWIELYNHGRLHSSLAYYTPMEYHDMHKPSEQG